MTFSPGCKPWRIPSFWETILAAQVLLSRESIIQRTGIPFLIVNLLGTYPEDTWRILTSWIPLTSLTLGSALVFAAQAGFVHKIFGNDPIPSRFNPLEILNKERATTTIPAVLKKSLAAWPLTADVSPPTPNRPGAVPRANTPIVKAPAIGLPVLMAKSCMAWVKPQGRKKVTAPAKNGISLPLKLSGALNLAAKVPGS